MQPAYAYALLGIGFIIILGALFFGSSNVKPIIYNLESSTMDTLTLQSSAFENGATIPSKYTCDGDRTLSPPLSISGIPEGTISFALIMDDPDVPKARRPEGVFDHWVVYDILPPVGGGVLQIPEGAMIGTVGLNGAGEAAYTGPCPPSEFEPAEHRYFFKLYALSGTLNFAKAPTKQELLDAIEGQVVENVALMGRYKRNAKSI